VFKSPRPDQLRTDRKGRLRAAVFVYGPGRIGTNPRARGVEVDDERRYRWLVAGRVQGVGFRWFVTQAARELGIRGDARNLSDGRVEIRAVGDSRRLEALLADVRQGPPAARVDDVQQLRLDDDWGPEAFGIRH
jgi:acylphosphatase